MVISAVVVVAAACSLWGRIVGWGVVWHWFTGWWTPGWGNLFTVGIAAAGVVAAIWSSRRTLALTNTNFERAQDATRTQFTQARMDSRIEKLRAEIAALVAAIDEQQSVGVKITAGIVDAMGQMGLPTPLTHEVAPQPENPDEHYSEMRRALIAAEATFEENVSPIYRRIAAHAFGVLMLTDDPEIIRPVDRLDSNLAAEWSFMREMYKMARTSVNGTQFAYSAVEWGLKSRPIREARQNAIQGDRDQLRRYALERFSKLES